jgi:hypothetical protein
VTGGTQQGYTCTNSTTVNNMPANTQYAFGSDGSEISLDLIKLGQALGNVSSNYTAEQFSTVSNLSRLKTVYTVHAITGPLVFTVAPGGTVGGEAVYTFIANGNAAHVPNFPDTSFKQFTSSAGWVNVAGTTNIVSVVMLNSQAYYSISQVVVPVVPPAPIDPSAEVFISIPRRTTDITLTGTTYAVTDAAASPFNAIGVSDIKLAGDGYVLVEPGTVNTGPYIYGLKTSDVLSNFLQYLFTVVAKADRTTVDIYTGATLLQTVTVNSTAQQRLRRVGTAVVFETKLPSAATWVLGYTFSNTFAGNLWFGFGLYGATASVNGSLINPRMFGGS